MKLDISLALPRKAPMSRSRLSRLLAVGLICMGALIGSVTAEEHGAVAGERTQEATTLQQRPQCAAEPQCTGGSAAVCMERGVCRRGATARPEQACLNYACVAKLQKAPVQVLPAPPVVVAPKLAPKDVVR